APARLPGRADAQGRPLARARRRPDPGPRVPRRDLRRAGRHRRQPPADGADPRRRARLRAVRALSRRARPKPGRAREFVGAAALLAVALLAVALLAVALLAAAILAAAP